MQTYQRTQTAKVEWLHHCLIRVPSQPGASVSRSVPCPTVMAAGNRSSRKNVKKLWLGRTQRLLPADRQFISGSTWTTWYAPRSTKRINEYQHIFFLDRREEKLGVCDAWAYLGGFSRIKPPNWIRFSYKSLKCIEMCPKSMETPPSNRKIPIFWAMPWCDVFLIPTVRYNTIYYNIARG